MSCRVSELVMNCHDPEALSQFWREALDYIELSRDGDIIEIGPESGFGGPTHTIVFTLVGELKTVPLRLRIDINPVGRDQDAELERLLALGARPTEVGQTGEEPWHVLADPESNEFCLLSHR